MDQQSNSAAGRAASPSGKSLRAVWARHAGDRYWHAIASIVTGQSAVTFCRGRWPARDEVEIDEAPPHDERCDECARQMIDIRRTEQGLGELARVADLDE